MADRPPRRFRRLLRIVAAGLGVIVLMGAGLWLALPTIAERMITERLVAMGVPEPRLTLRDIGLTGATAADMRLGAAGELTADSVTITYRLPELFDGVIDSIAIDGATIHASVGPDGLSLGSLDAFLGGDGGGPLPALPPIEIDGASLTIATALGPIEIATSGSITSVSGGLDAALRLSANATQGEAAGTLALRLRQGAIEAELNLADARLSLPDLVSAQATGRLRLSAANGRLDTFGGHLDIDNVAVGEPRVATFGKLDGSVDFDHDADGWHTAVNLSDAAGTTTAELRAAARDLALDVPVSMSIDLSAKPDAALWPLLGLPIPTAGDASAQVVAEVTPSSLLSAVNEGILPALRGSVALELDGIVLPGTLETLSAVAGLDVETLGDTLRLDAPAPFLADLTLAPGLIADAGLPADAANLIGGPLAFTLTLPETLRIEQRDDGHAVIGRAGLSVDLADGTRLLDLAASGETFMSGSGVFAYDLPMLDTRLSLPEGTALPAGEVMIAGRASGNAAQGDAEMTLNAVAPKAAVAGFDARALSIALPLAIAHADSRIDVRLTDKGSITAERLAGRTPFTLDGPIRLPLQSSETPALTVDFAAADGPQVVLDLAAGPVRLTGALETEDGPLPGEASLPRLRITGNGNAAGWSTHLQASDGTLTLPSYAVEATGIDLTIDLPAGAAPRIALAGALAHRGEPAYVIPLTARIDAHGVRNGWAFTGTAKDAFGRISLAIDGRHDLARGTGSATLKLAPIELIPGVRQPEDLAPWLAGFAGEVSGTVALAGDVSWTPDLVASKLELLVRDLSATTDAAIISQVNGVIAIDGLAPFTTPPGQQVAVALIDAGLPLTDGLLTFRIAPGPVVEIAGGTLHLAGGTVDVEPLAFDPWAARNEAVLAVSGVELGEMLALAGVDGLTGEGRMSGRIPVVIADNDVIITHGELEAEAPGHLSYAPLSPPAALQGQGESVSLALSALTNFQYEALRLTVDRQAGGEMTVAMHIRGKNPDFYDGYPVEFNLNVSGALDRVLRQGLAGYRIPAAIEERLQEFGQ
jgi:hypothetical protein